MRKAPSNSYPFTIAGSATSIHAVSTEPARMFTHEPGTQSSLPRLVFWHKQRRVRCRAPRTGRRPSCGVMGKEMPGRRFYLRTRFSSAISPWGGFRPADVGGRQESTIFSRGRVLALHNFPAPSFCRDAPGPTLVGIGVAPVLPVRQLWGLDRGYGTCNVEMLRTSE